ncbi:MAG: hypothetical protein OEQ12_02025 [Nitrosopumilus sp.]|nr:hypothetical protein [Nitrosopumilus sp.]
MNRRTILGISIAAILAISVASVSVIPDAFAVKPTASHKPDFVANFDAISDPENEFNGQSFRAMFWVEGEDEGMKIAYKVILNKVDVGEYAEALPNPGQDGNNGEGLTHFLWKLHVHPAPDGVHDASEHYFNIVGPADDEELKIAGNTLTGIWDENDFQNLPNDDHESIAPNTVIEEMCNEDTDINIHLQDDTGESELQIRGQLIPNTDFCDSLI